MIKQIEFQPGQTENNFLVIGPGEYFCFVFRSQRLVGNDDVK